MKFKVSLSAMLLVLLGSGVLWAGDPWKEKPWTEWTEKDVQRILNKSPWAKKLNWRLDKVNRVAAQELESPEWETKRGGITVSLEGVTETVYTVPGSGIPEPVITRRGGIPFYHRVFVRWLSSLTVRQAFVRQAQFEMKRMSVQEQQFGHAPQLELLEYVIAVRAVVTAGLSNDELRQSAYLQPKRSKQRIPATRVSDSEFGRLLYFPRELNGKPIIGPQDTKVEFSCCKVEGQKPIKVTFDLRKMVRDGKPDL